MISSTHLLNLKYVTYLALSIFFIGSIGHTASKKVTSNKCSTLYKSGTVAPTPNKKESDTLHSSSVILSDYQMISSKEVVLIRDGYKQFPGANYFSLDFVGSFIYRQDPMGDQMKVFIYPESNPFVATPLGDKNKSTSMPVSTALMPPPSSHPAVDPKIIAREYVLKFYADRELSESTIQLVVDTIIKSPALLADALAKYPKIKDAKSLELTNYDLNRYFWFKPQDHSEVVAARILDIHKSGRPDRFVFLAEYTLPHETNSGQRIRHIVELKLEEFRTITDSYGGKTRQDAASEFFDSLSPDEIRALRLARNLNLPLFGFFDIRRGPGIINENAQTPLQEMNNIVHLAMSAHIERTFGTLPDLLTTFEKQQTYPNYMDVFGRLNPHYVFKRFGDARARDTEFIWVITEDGQLKIMPAMNIGNNLKPQLLRFAAGRKVFAGGTFIIREDHSLDLQLNANGYQQADSSWGLSSPYRSNSRNLENFVRVIFGIQMQAKVNKIGEDPVETWTRYDSHSYESHRDYRDQDFEFTNSFFDSMKSQAEMKSKQPAPNIKWDRNSLPLDLTQYAKQRDQSERDINMQLDWSHYILDTHSSMAWGDIKKQYRILSQKFHPDKNIGNPNAEIIMKSINHAFSILEAELRK